MKRFPAIIILCAIGLTGVCQKDTSESSFYHIYDRVFSRSCALAACHDGTFEPDFRTPQSSYYTTVYHPVIKNDTTRHFKYRITPYDCSSSLLYQRITNCCFVNQNDRMPLSILNTGKTLPQQEIIMIADWIRAGAKDLCGNTPSLTRLRPSVSKEYKVSSNDTNILSEEQSGSANYRHRVEHLHDKPLIIPSMLKFVRLEFKLIDDEPDTLNTVLPLLEISMTSSEFTDAKVLVPTKKTVSSYIVEILPDQFQKDRVYYMRVKVKDDSQGKIDYYPSDETTPPEKRYWSFVIKK